MILSIQQSALQGRIAFIIFNILDNIFQLLIKHYFNV